MVEAINKKMGGITRKFSDLAWSMRSPNSDWIEVGKKQEIVAPQVIQEIKKAEKIPIPVKKKDVADAEESDSFVVDAGDNGVRFTKEAKEIEKIVKKKVEKVKKVVPKEMSELRHALKEKGVKVPRTAKKKDLIKLYNDN